jgi:hypothetical protein
VAKTLFEFKCSFLQLFVSCILCAFCVRVPINSTLLGMNSSAYTQSFEIIYIFFCSLVFDFFKFIFTVFLNC